MLIAYNKPMRSKIIKNAVWLFSGQAIGRALRAILIVVAARTLGVSDWGVFAYAISLAATFTVFSDIGINALLVREGSRNAKLAIKYLATGLVIKLTLIAVLATLVFLLKDVIIRIPEATVLIPLIIVIFAIDSLRDFVSALARFTERMDIEAKGQIITNMGIVTFGLLFLAASPSSASLALGYVLGTFLGLVVVFLPLKSYFKGIFREFSRPLVRSIIVSAWPFGLVGLMGVIMINTDILVLGAIGQATDVGLYAAAQKPVQLLYLIPSVLAAAFFPTMSREAGDTGQFRSTLEKGLKSAYIFAIPLAFGGVLTASPIISFLYGPEFLLSYSSFAILSLTFLFVFPSVFFANALFARGSQKVFYGYLAIGVLVNIALNLILIPYLGIIGCALATLIVQAFLFIYGVVHLKRSLSFSVFPGIGRAAISAFIMILLIVALLWINAHPLIIVSLGATVYFLSLFILREPMLREIIAIFRRNPNITSGVEV